MALNLKAELEKALEEGKSLEEICVRWRYSVKGLSIAMGKYRLAVPTSIQEEIKTQRRIPSRDALIAMGLPLREIAEQEGCRKQTIWFYLQKTGQQEFYKERRAVVKQEIGSTYHKRGVSTPRRSQRLVLGMLEQYITKRCPEAGFAYEKAWEYLQNTDRRTTKTFSELLQLFDGYNYAREKGAALSLQELGEFFGWREGEVSFILTKVNLPTLCYPESYKSTRTEFARKKERILSCFDLPLSTTDVGYFSDVFSGTVRDYFQEKGSRPWVKSGGIKRFAILTGRGVEAVLTYRSSSRIYEADDAGFTLEEICEYVPTKPVAVEYAREHRQEIEPVIITALRRLYQGEEFTKPYRNTYGIMF